MNTDITMKLDMLHEAIGLIDFDLIEESEAAPEKAARVTAFAKPWMKWVVAAVLIIVIGVGTPVALNMMGAFRNENFVSPSGGNDNYGVVTPVGGDSESSEPESGSGQSSEEASSSSEGEKPAHGDSSGHADSGSENPPVIESESAPGSSEQEPESGSSETQDEPGTGGEPGSEGPTSGEFIKDNMPAVTYKINGEYKTFDYQSSTALVDSGSSYVVDRYVGNDSSIVSVNAEFGYVMQYWENESHDFHADNNIQNEEDAVNMANSIAVSSDIALVGIENAEATVRYAENKYYVTLTVPSGKVEICFDIKGKLQYLIIDKFA